MVLGLLLSIVIAYAAAVVDVHGLVAKYGLHDDALTETDYPHLLKRYGRGKTLLFLLADLLLALIVTVIGAAVLHSAGFQSVGRLVVLFAVLLARVLPLNQLNKSIKEPVFPALVLLCADWKLFLVCVLLALAAVALTGSRGCMMLTAAVALPLFMLIFGGWLLKIFLALLCAAELAWIYLPEIREFLSGIRNRKTAARGRGSRSDQRK